MDLPILAGTENQIARANRYREMTARAIAAVTTKAIDYLNRNGHPELAGAVDEASGKLLAETNAGWWIEHEPRINAFHSSVTVAESCLLNAMSSLDEDELDMIRDALDA